MEPVASWDEPELALAQQGVEVVFPGASIFFVAIRGVPGRHGSRRRLAIPLAAVGRNDEPFSFVVDVGKAVPNVSLVSVPLALENSEERPLAGRAKQGFLDCEQVEEEGFVGGKDVARVNEQGEREIEEIGPQVLDRQG